MAPGIDAKDSQQNFARRDTLLQIQENVQHIWDEEKIFAVDAPSDDGPVEKYFGTFPYPYMNGLLHLGHAFSISKLEFASAYHRLCGKKVLFAQGFHCTGMPIKACADKLDRELTTYGCPPVFPTEEDNVTTDADPAPIATPEAKADPTKFGGKKSKAVQKQGKETRQWEILTKSGIAESEVPAFRQSAHWLTYFPPLGLRDLKAMGCGVDWRRAFITTDMNPFYDSFVRWQFNTLYKRGKVVKDKRYTVYSPLDGQPCADHDRATGEGAGPQEYTLIKLEVLELSGKLEALKGQGRVFLLAATLRPETMYGQTNCWALPEGDYGAFRGAHGDVYVMTKRSALNLSFQERMPVRGAPELLLALKGQDLIGLPVRAPRSPHKHVYVLPLLTILTNKGTGIVTSVPSDSPDDYTALTDLKKKPKLREKFGVKDEWVLPFEVIPIIDIPGYGNQAAVKVVEEMGIQSQNDRDKLEKAKADVYLKGFNEGVLLVGNHAGRRVAEAKPIIKEEMIAEGDAILYSEPEKYVKSRSGDDCVVALTDQWYITYGEEEWQALTREALNAMELYSEEVKNSFHHCLGWLKYWACSRSFGLGTRMPWDEQFLIESLSDSTIYMAYYTVAHMLHGGDMYGTGVDGIKAEDMTHEVWDYIFLGGDLPAGSAISAERLAAMRREFEFWYPMDLRVSAKDLIQNHLTFALYNHTAMWPREKWPLAYRCNGHLLLDNEKMSKSTGNFKTLQEGVYEFSADAMRWAMADAGDGMDDANFVTSTANVAILRLTKELEWVKEVLASAAAGSLREGPPSTLFDRTFANEMNIAVSRARAAYDRMLFREALQVAAYQLSNARDAYRFASGPEGMNRDLLLRYIEVSTLLMVPITPHTSEHVWRNLLLRAGSALTAGWPAAEEPDYKLQRAAKYLEDLVPTLRKLIQKAETPAKKKGGGVPAAPVRITRADVFIAQRFVGWQEAVLHALAANFDSATREFVPTVFDAAVEAARGDEVAAAGRNDKQLKALVLPFAKFKMQEAAIGGAQVLDVRMPFDEAELLRENTSYLLRSLGLEEVHVHAADDAEAVAAVAALSGVKVDPSAACPGQPMAILSATGSTAAGPAQ